MSISKKPPPGPIRQLSLNTPDVSASRRKNLKKQFSEDQPPQGKEKWIPALGLSVSLCPKNQMKIHDRPPPAKLAWIENETNNEECVIAKKYKEIKRPITAKVPRQTPSNKDTILLSHQELAERLRQAWKDREKGKQNLNIFLAHNVKEKQEEEFNNELTEQEELFAMNKNFDKTMIKPKLILPLKPEVKEVNYKNIFQKRMRRTHSVDEPLKNLVYSPTRTRTVVVVPLAEPKIQTESPNNLPQKHEEKIVEQEECKPIDVIIRPTSAITKREVFRSRANSAFNNSSDSNNHGTRPPLIRASSVQLKQPQAKPKFVAVKRKVKSATKKKEQEKIEVLDEDEDKEKKSNGKKFQRCVSVSGAEIITMVSLISPEDSETEEQIEVEKEKPKSKTNSPVKTISTTDNNKNEKVEHQKNFTLRKAVKSVSFQQSSIHAVRSFSASFPARRASVVTTLMLNNNAAATKGSQEKRGTAENVAEDVREPKRRLLRTKSAPHERSLEEQEGENNIPKAIGNLKPSKNVENTQKETVNIGQSSKTQLKGDVSSETPESENTVKSFDTPKEKQCWDMFRKMSEKGVNISFDTILRGVLTPTEYRLRKKSISTTETPEHPDDITADS